MPPPRAPGRLLVLAAALSGALVVVDASPAMTSGPVAACARAALAPTCHQEPARSFGDWAACARCVGVHAGGLLALLAFFATGGWWSRRRLAALTVLAAAAMAADVAAGIALPWDHAALRCATGALLSASILAWGACAVSAERDG